MSVKISRRELIQKSLLGFGALSVAASLTGCNDHETEALKVNFEHGVASGDPLQDSIILWTRLTPNDTSVHLRVTWEIATDAQFKNIVNTGKVQTSAAQDFIVKIDADKLQANQRYFYRFKFGDKISPIGQTKTLPTTTTQVSFAVCTCANYPAGYFHVYKEMAKQNVDVIIHLGDYIYEYGQDGYATEDAIKMGRTFAADNKGEIIKLDDYRKRYAWYRKDQDLQSLHHRHPFIVIWDDHELANDTYKDGAENHQSASEGAFSARKAAALQAYFEWMPIRPVDEQHTKIYRQFNFGQLVQLTMLDTRILARDKQLDYADYFSSTGDFQAQQFQADLLNPARTMMGIEQRNWLFDKLARSTAKWNVLGQQVVMGKMLIPAELAMELQLITASAVNGNVDPAVLVALNKKITELVTLKMRLKAGDPSLTAAEKARVLTVIPYNLDAWDGYYIERETLYGALAQFNKKVVVLAGDSHNAWSSRLHRQNADGTQGAFVGVEFAASSVTSPGLEQYLKIPTEQLIPFEGALKTLVDEMKYCNLNQRGYVLVQFNETQVNAEWIYVNTVKEKTYTVDQARGYQITLDQDLLPVQTAQQVA